MSHHKSNSDLQKELQQIQAAKHDPANFGVLYDAYYKSIFVFIYRRTGSEDISSDLSSLVFLKALINIKKYEYKGVPFSAWLFRIAFNEINMYFRKNKADRIVSLEQSSISSIVVEAETDNNSEAQQKMMLALIQLNETEMQLIELRFFEKRSFAEVGAILDITENNAKVKVYRILDKLKAIMTKNNKH